MLKKKYVYLTAALLILFGVAFYGVVTHFIEEEKVKENTTLLFRKEFDDGDVVKYMDEEDPPEMFANFNFEGFTEKELREFLPEAWDVEEFSEDLVSMVYEGGQYEGDQYDGKENEEPLNDSEYEQEELKYISIYKDRIAIYEGSLEENNLIEVTRYKAKDVYRKELERGIPFTTEEEREKILESYTS